MTAPGWPSARTAWLMTAVLTFAYTLAFLHRIGLSLFVESIRLDLGISDTAIGLLTGAFFAIPYTLAAPVAGWLVDRFHRLQVLGWAAVLWSVATALGMSSYAALVTGRVLTGIGQSVVQPASASLIADVFAPAQRARGYGVFVAGTAFGTAAAYFAGALALALGARWSTTLGLTDWQAAIVVLGAAGLLVPLGLLLVREPARRERENVVAPKGAVLSFVRARAWVFTALFAGVALTFLAPYGQLAFMPSLFIRKYGWAAEEVAVTFGAIAAVAGVLGSVSAGALSSWLVGRGYPSAPWLVCVIGALGCLIPGAIAPLMPTGALCMAMFTLSGAFANYPAVGVLAAIAEVTPNEFRGQVTALYTGLVGLVAAALGPLVVGVLADHWSAGGPPVAGALSVTFAGCALVATGLLLAGLPEFRRLAGATARRLGTGVDEKDGKLLVR
jgi:MFS family permease